jgi:hypothetical protein
MEPPNRFNADEVVAGDVDGVDVTTDDADDDDGDCNADDEAGDAVDRWLLRPKLVGGLGVVGFWDEENICVSSKDAGVELDDPFCCI